MSATVVIVASTSRSSIPALQGDLDEVAAQTRSLGLTDVRVTHLRGEDGTISTPDGAGMGDAGDVTVEELTAPPVTEDIRPDVAEVLAKLAALTEQVRALTSDRS